MRVDLLTPAAALEECAGQGRAAERAIRFLARYAEAVGAESFIRIVSAHIDSCLYHGLSSIDFARSFEELGGAVRVPTTLNVAAVDMCHPELHQGAPELLHAQAELTALYEAMGCQPTLTCAPYQRLIRPGLRDQIAWAESNAIVFANSVLGARTDRYGDFTDLCAAITGLVPYTGLHCAENRLAKMAVTVPPLESTDLPRDLYFACVGYVIGFEAQTSVPAIIGLPHDSTEDELKALGSAAASSGAVALFHAIGITPEAPTLEDVTPSEPPNLELRIVSSERLNDTVAELCPIQPGEPVAAACFGTPHFSISEFRQLAELVSDAPPCTDVYVSTSREIADEIRTADWAAPLRLPEVQLVVDTCTYLAPVVRNTAGVIVTNSAKYAHYAPGNLRRRVGLMSLERCVRSAAAGRIAPK